MAKKTDVLRMLILAAIVREELLSPRKSQKGWKTTIFRNGSKASGIAQRALCFL